jgi:hypothetical protein
MTTLNVNLSANTVYERESSSPLAPLLLAQLHQACAMRPESINWLVVAHNDSAMIRHLWEVIDPWTAAVLQVPQPDWDFSHTELAEAVDWALNYTQIQHLMLLGHSGAWRSRVATAAYGVVPGDDSLGASGHNAEWFDRMVDRAANAQQQLQRSKQLFAKQVEKVGKIERLQSAVSTGRLKLHAAFYMSHSGSFLPFDIAEHRLAARYSVV